MIVPGMMQLYVTRAHVFQINTETKNSWVSKDESAVPVGFFGIVDNQPQHAQIRGVKIVAQDREGNTIIASPLTAKTVFNKRSQKFGQWTDPSGMIYGLGFNTEDDLNHFITTFHQVLYDAFGVKKENPLDTSPPQQQPQAQAQQMAATNATYVTCTQQQPQQPLHLQLQQPIVRHHLLQQPLQQQPRQTANFTSETSAQYQSQNDDKVQPMDTNQPAQQEVRRSLPAQDQQHPPEKDVESDTNNNGLNGSNGVGPEDQDELISQSPSPNNPELQIQQLMYENERIKETLEEAKKNAALWETELQNLRTNNVKLTKALQESKSNVEEWERELLWLREENKDLKKRMLSDEDEDDPLKTSCANTELVKMRSLLEMTQHELQEKTKDLKDTENELRQLEAKLKAADNGKSEDAISVEVAISLAQKQRFDQINSKLEAKISELVNVQKEYAQLADKLYH